MYTTRQGYKRAALYIILLSLFLESLVFSGTLRYKPQTLTLLFRLDEHILPLPKHSAQLEPDNFRLLQSDRLWPYFFHGNVSTLIC